MSEEIRQDVSTVFTSSFGNTRTGKTVTVSILDEDGNAKIGGHTVGTLYELSNGFYGVKITFTAEFSGTIKWNNTTDGFILYHPFVVTDDMTKVRKINTNRWKITSNQMVFYDDDGTTALFTFDLKKLGVANDGTDPDERVISP